MTQPDYDVIIVGAGILGCASAYYLTRDTDLQVLLIDRQLPASGTTSQAAGLIGRAKSDPAVLDLVDETWTTIQALQDAGETIDLHTCGSLHVASAEHTAKKILDTSLELERRNRKVEWLGQKETSVWLPWLNAIDSRVIGFFPEDGYVDPYQLTMAYYRQAKLRGLTARFDTEVMRLISDDDRITGLVTRSGEKINARHVVLAGGPWTALLAKELGVYPAMAPVRSHYWMTSANNNIPANCPVMILPDANAYIRPEVGGLLFGLRDRQRVHCSPALLPRDILSFQFEKDSDGFESLEEGWMPLQTMVNLLSDIPISDYISSVSSYTPDGRFLIGETEELDGLWLATGCCGGGIGSSAGFGRLIAEQIANKPTFTATEPFNPNRFAGQQVNPFDTHFRLRCAIAREGKTSG